MRAARGLLGWDQRRLAAAAGLSLATVQRMESSDDTVRGVVESLVKVVTALEDAGIELIPSGAASSAGGRGVRLRDEVAPAREA
jgi:transcriptional regulator with XRE-family HTH domain